MTYANEISREELLEENRVLRDRLLQLEAQILSDEGTRELNYRLKIEEAIADCSRLLAGPGYVDIYRILQLIGQAVNGHRACIYEFVNNTMIAINTYEWCAPGAASKMAELKTVDMGMFAWSMGEIAYSRAVNMPDVRSLPPEADNEKDILLWAEIYSLVAVPIFDSEHNLSAWMGFVDTKQARQWRDEDIRCLQLVAEMLGTYWERQKSEKALRDSEAMFRLLADMTPALTYITDLKPGNPLLYFNQAVSRLSGYSREEILAMDPWDIIYPEDKDLLIKRGSSRLRGEEVIQNYEIRFIRKDNTIGYGLLNASPIEWEGQRALIVVTYDISAQKLLVEELRQARDELELTIEERTADLIRLNRDLRQEIRERKQAEEELRQSETNFKKLAEASPAIIFVYNTEELLYLNSPGEAISGYSSAECLGRPAWYMIHEDYRRMFWEAGQARLEGKYIPPYEIKLVHKDGREIWGLITGDIIEFEGQTCNIGAVLDITEHKKMEQELLKKERLETLGLLAGGIAHDFNNILTVISGNASLGQLILSGNDDDEISGLLEEIKIASLQATRLTSQLLTFSKGGAPVKESLTVQDLVKEAARFTLAESNINCVFSMDNDLWTIEVDRDQMLQAIGQLITNACQAMPQGGEIHLEAVNYELTDSVHSLVPGKYVRIAVIDEGSGIDESDLPKIFNPYFTTKEKGRGMGLPVTESIIAKHGGAITVKPNPEKGTTFEVFLPACTEMSQGHMIGDKFDFKDQGRILVMDDEENIRVILGRMLKKLGYNAEMACDGREAIEHYTRGLQDSQPFDAVIMDLTIPGGMGGSETVRELLKIDPALKAIVSSGYSSDPVMANYSEYGFAGVIPKPYEITKLNRILREVLSQKTA